MRKLSTFGVIIILAALASGVAFTQGGQAPGQAPAAAVIPNVVGAWSAEIAEVRFGDPYNPDEPPSFSGSNSQGTPVLFITHQNGRTFAGYLSAQTGQHDKFTGAVMEDGTITVQVVAVFQQGTPNRGLLWGKVSPLKSPTSITAIGHGFEELSSQASPSFTSFYLKLKKVQ